MKQISKYILVIAAIISFLAICKTTSVFAEDISIPIPPPEIHDIKIEPQQTTPPVAPDSKNDTNQKDQSTQSTNNGEYKFLAPEGSNLTLLVRKSLQLYDESNKDLSLTPASTIFAETNIVKEIGAKEIDVDEPVTVKKDIIQKYTSQTLALTPEQTASWQTYADNVNFDLSYIKPVSGTVATNDESSNATNKVSGSDNANKDTGANKDSGAKTKAPWYWWLIGAGSVGLLYYILGGKQGSKKLDEEK